MKIILYKLVSNALDLFWESEWKEIPYYVKTNPNKRMYFQFTQGTPEKILLTWYPSIYSTGKNKELPLQLIGS